MAASVFPRAGKAKPSERIIFQHKQGAGIFSVEIPKSAYSSGEVMVIVSEYSLSGTASGDSMTITGQQSKEILYRRSAFTYYHMTEVKLAYKNDSASNAVLKFTASVNSGSEVNAIVVY